VSFEHKRDKSIAGLHVMAAHFRPARDLRIATSDREVLVERGEHINLTCAPMFLAAYRLIQPLFDPFGTNSHSTRVEWSWRLAVRRTPTPGRGWPGS
jgi:hypothetical protein